MNKRGSASIINRQNFEVYDELFRRCSPSLQRFCFAKRFFATPTHFPAAKQCTALTLPYGVKQAAKRQAKQCTALTLPYGVKQAAKRQAKQCTALFCPHPLAVNSKQ
ncbi:MAG: hypothetical protein LBK66_01655 [Spirochaetaceae bacterium]|jgi:hypothetical protein|nr:hypothetical protein [Spirochaetaceae bacterium]